MNRQTMVALATAGSLCLGIALTRSNAVVQHNSLKEQLMGTWTAVSVDNVLEDGSRVQSYGPNPSGLLMFDGNGHFSLLFIRSDIPKFASNKRDMGTPEENKAVIQGSVSNFGTYSVSPADRTLILRIENSSFPNWKGTDQKRIITSISERELTWRNPVASIGGTAEAVWKRTN